MSSQSQKETLTMEEIARLSDEEYLDYIGNYKPGSIRTIRLKSFLTYKSVVIRPGPRLNVVAGANGTGKSTILNAICLGLGGDPKLLGRAEDVRDFIMHNELVAEIEITLAPVEDKAEHTIKRVIDRRRGSENGKGRGSSMFYLNGQKVTVKEVQELVKETYGIAIENLCTFLPQDKVGNFSALSPQELLLETEKVLAKDGFFINMHRELIEQEDKIHAGSSDVETLQSKLKKLKHENEQLERTKNLMEEREQALQQLDLLRKKALWLEFDALRLHAVELKDQRAAIKVKLREANGELEPLRKQLESLESEMKQVEARSRDFDSKIKASLNEAEKQAKKYEKHDDDIEQQLLELRALDDKREQAESNVRVLQERVDDLKGQLEALSTREELEAQLAQAASDRKQAQQQHGEAKKDVRRLQNQLDELDGNALRAQRKVERLGDAAAQRKAMVFQKFPHLAKASAWIEDHRGSFRRPVVGPIAAEITPSSAQAAAFIEQQVPSNSLKAFCVECKEDQDLLYNEVRVKLGIPINILVVRKQQQRPRMYSSEKMRPLQKHGVIGYLDEMFTAPEIVLQSLISTSQIDRVLVGEAKAYENMAALKKLLTEPEPHQDGLQSFVLCCTSRDDKNFKFQGTKSRYANQVSTRQDDILPARFLMPGVDPAALSQATEELNSVHKEINELRPVMLQAEKDAQQREITLQERAAACEVCAKRLNSWKKFHEKYQNSLRKLKEAKEALSSDDDAEKKQLVATLMNRVVHSINALETRAQHQSIMLKVTAEWLGVAANKTSMGHAHRLAELAHHEMKQAHQELENEAVRIDTEFKRARKEVGEKQLICKREAPIEDEDGNELPLRQELEAIGLDTLDQVEVAMEEAEGRANAIDANPDVIRQYEIRKKQIEELEIQVDYMVQAKNEKTAQMETNRRRWENSLEEQIAVISSLFTKYMSEMGNAGELMLYKGEVDDNGNSGSFKDWGLKILVSFRGESKVQVLSAQSHSGGERAVSTIMFLMACQDMLVAPFRCVDEINQGLDERNERLVFRRIVANSCSLPGREPVDHSGQYFLITPKLLPNLEDMQNPGITVLTVFNGPYNDVEEFHTDLLIKLVGSKRTLEAAGASDDENHEGNVVRDRPLKKRAS